MIRLTAADGHELDAYLAEPSGDARGSVIVVQEVFGVTAHVERVVREYAALGYRAIAPAMFDRIERGVVLAYTELQTGLGLMRQLQWPDTLADVGAAFAAVRGGATAVVGFCWGGTVAHVAASELPVDAVVSYYGGGVARTLDKRPRCPIMYHFGDRDAAIPLTDVEQIRSACPDSIVHVYEGAGHGFNCEDRPSFDPSAARAAFGRSALFIDEQLVKCRL